MLYVDEEGLYTIVTTMPVLSMISISRKKLEEAPVKSKPSSDLLTIKIIKVLKSHSNIPL